jgi:serine/threonine protein kinase
MTVPADMRAVADGTRLGKYQLLRRLATGGMAELFLARTTAMAGFEKLVVLKRILPQHAESDDFIKMFLTEARLAATLHHPNIVQVYDIGEEGGHYFFTMEWVQGQDLRRIVRAARKASVPIPLEHVLHIIAGVAAGLDHAHGKVDTDGTPLGIVHRDVSPSNVLVTYDGAVKLVDFGIAKAAAFQSNTVAGTLKGKVPYMSPEQCRGEAVDRRSDIFSIGTLLWEMTTGSRLFAGDNEIAIINRVARGDVPLPTSVRPDYPPELEPIVMRALHADPTQRYQQAVDLQIDLEDFSREHRLPVSSARMGKFMRDLFAEEIATSAAQLQSVRRDTSGPVPALPQDSLPPVPGVAGATAQTVVEADVLEIPSEVLGRSPHSRVESDVSRSSVTRASASTLGLDDEVPRPRRGWVIAVAALVGLGVVGGGAYALVGPGATATAEDAPSVVIRADAPEPSGTAPTASSPAPTPPPAVAAPPVEPPVVAPLVTGTIAPVATPTSAPTPKLDTEDEPVEVLPEATPAKPEPRPTEAKPSKPKKTPGERRADPKKPTPPDTPKPKQWDPDAPMPPPGK